MIKVADVTDLFSPRWDEILSDAETVSAPPVIHPHPDWAHEWVGTWGGWGIMTKSGAYEDAFTSGQYVMSDDGALASAQQINDTLQDTKWTEVATDSMKDIIEQVKRRGLFPTRAKITVLAPHSVGPWHIDSPSAPLFRLHFILKTNKGALFESKENSWHLAEKRAYIFNANFAHRIVNSGDEERIHLMMNVNLLSRVEKICESRWI